MNKPRHNRQAAKREKHRPPERTFTLGAVFAPEGHISGTDQAVRFASRIQDTKAFLGFWTAPSKESYDQNEMLHT